jgi:hypothetical protein
MGEVAQGGRLQPGFLQHSLARPGVLFVLYQGTISVEWHRHSCPLLHTSVVGSCGYISGTSWELCNVSTSLTTMTGLKIMLVTCQGVHHNPLCDLITLSRNFHICCAGT